MKLANYLKISKKKIRQKKLNKFVDSVIDKIT
jgi:hypothetical protein